MNPDSWYDDNLDKADELLKVKQLEDQLWLERQLNLLNEENKNG